MNMLEKAARAAAHANGEDYDRLPPEDHEWVSSQKDYRKLVRAVLAAIREPDDATASRTLEIASNAGNVVPGEKCAVTKNYIRSYVDAILEGESK